MAERAPHFSTLHLLLDAVAQMAALFRTEIRLVGTELKEKVAQAVGAVALIAGAIVLLLAGVFVVLLGIVAWLVAAGIPAHFAAFIVGVPVLAAGGALLYSALATLRRFDLRPDRALDQVTKDMAVAKEMVR